MFSISGDPDAKSRYRSAFVLQILDDAAQTMYICIQVVSAWLIRGRFSDYTDDKLAAVHLPYENAAAIIFR